MTTQKFSHVVVTTSWAERLRERFEGAVPADRYSYPRTTQDVDAALRTADVAVIGSNADRRFVVAPELRWLHVDHAGIDSFAPPDLFTDRVVTTSAGRSAPALADHAVFLLQSVLHDARTIDRLRRRRAWQPGRLAGVAATGGRAVVVGTGKTGCELALRLRAMGISVTGVRRSAAAGPAGFDVTVSSSDRPAFLDALATADVLFLAAGLNDASHHLVDAEVLASLPDGAVLVNVARGGLVDEAALIDALRAGRLGGAGLDVTTHEPLAPWSPLWRLRGVVLTPHVTPRLPDRDERSLAIVADVAGELADGRRPRSALTTADAYTKGRPRSRAERVATRAWNRLMRAIP